jgi:ribosome-binding factor A
MSTFKRTDRIAEMLQRKLSVLIPQEVKDPRLPKFITISSVSVAADLSHAKVYFTVLDQDPNETQAILNDSAKLLRKALARSVTLRTVPALHFHYDESIEYGKHLSKLIDELNPKDQTDEQD